MRIAVLGTGPIGSTFALHLARGGHDVTVIARGERLRQLEADRAIVSVKGESAPVHVAPALDPGVPFDLVLVTVLAHKVDAVLPVLQASRARTVMFMFNTFAPIDRLRDAVGVDRFAFGFPAILATLPDGKLDAKIVTFGQTTITTDAGWAKVFSDAGIKTVVEPDMQSWLRTHAVFIVAMSAAMMIAYRRGAGITNTEARELARVLREGFAVTQQTGSAVIPAPIAALGRIPIAMTATVFWMMTRTKLVQLIGLIGPSEPRELADAILAAGDAPTLRAVRDAALA